MGIEIKVSDKEKTFLLEWIKKWLQSMSLDQERASWSSAIPSRRILEVLAAKISVQDIDGKQLIRTLSRKAIVSLKKQGQDDPTWQDVEQSLKNEIQLYLTQPTTEYSVLFLLHVDAASIQDKPCFDVLDSKFTQKSWPQISEQLEWSRLKKEVHHLGQIGFCKVDDAMIWWFAPLLAQTQARTYQEAFRQVETKFELLRALLNLTFMYGRVTFQSHPKPLGKVHPPPVYGIFGENGDYEGYYYTPERYSYSRPRARISLEQMGTIETILAQIRKTTDRQMKQLLVDTVLKYGNAMDTADWRTAFLSLWQILESVSLWDSPMKQSEITSRVMTLIGQNDPLYKGLLETLRQSRNELVHRGRFSEDGLQDVSFLKSVAESAIASLLARLEYFPTRRTLEEFYTHATLGDRVLKDRRSTIDAILESRNQPSIA